MQKSCLEEIDSRPFHSNCILRGQESRLIIINNWGLLRARRIVGKRLQIVKIIHCTISVYLLLD